MAERKPRPRTGEPRKTKQPLQIDRLPESVHEAIKYLRNTRFKTWLAIERLSAKPYSKDWAKDGGGFIDWPAIEPDVLDCFPGLKLPHTSLHRWYDLTVEQVRDQVLSESKTARDFAEQFSGATIEHQNDAVINALRDEVFTLAGKMDAGSRAQYMEALGNLTLAMSRMQRVEIQKRRVEVDERRVAQLEQEAETRRKRMDDETSKTVKGGTVTLDAINALRRNTFGLPPLDAQGNVVPS